MRQTSKAKLRECLERTHRALADIHLNATRVAPTNTEDTRRLEQIREVAYDAHCDVTRALWPKEEVSYEPDPRD